MWIFSSPCAGYVWQYLVDWSKPRTMGKSQWWAKKENFGITQVWEASESFVNNRRFQNNQLKQRVHSAETRFSHKLPSYLLNGRITRDLFLLLPSYSEVHINPITMDLDFKELKYSDRLFPNIWEEPKPTYLCVSRQHLSHTAFFIRRDEKVKSNLEKIWFITVHNFKMPEDSTLIQTNMQA